VFTKLRGDPIMPSTIHMINTNRADFYLKNKDYFDNKLITVLESYQKRVSKLEDTNDLLHTKIVRQQMTIKTLRWQKQDLKVITSNLNWKLKRSDQEIDEIKNELEHEIKKIGDRIEGELEDAYTINEELFDELEKLKKENELLRKQLKLQETTTRTKDSTNSSLPPSTDKGRRTNLREKTNRKRGGQVGHQLHRSKLSATPDKIEIKYVKQAPTGAIKVVSMEGETEYYVTQEISTELTTNIVETRYYITEKGIELEEAEKKKYAINPVTYSNECKAMVLYFNSKGTIALERLCQILKEISRGKLCLQPSTIINWQKELTKKSETERNQILETVLQSKVVHVDETGWKINGKPSWFHVMCCQEGAYFVVTKQRSDEDEGPLKKLEKFIGYLVHDHFKSYYRLEECIHVECNAHILRYLQSGIDYEENIGCMKLQKLFREMLHDKKQLIRDGKVEMEEAKIKEYETEYLEIIDSTLSEFEKSNPNMKAKYKPEYVALMKRLKKHLDEHLLFIKQFDVPFDNNAAERMARVVKAKKKISGQSYSTDRANDYAAILTINQTCTLQNKNALETIEGILSST